MFCLFLSGRFTFEMEVFMKIGEGEESIRAITWIYKTHNKCITDIDHYISQDNKNVTYHMTSRLKSDITLCIKIDKPLMVYILSNVM